MSLTRIGGAAVNQTPIDWQGNTSTILEAIKSAKEQGVQILCLPELCITGYGCEDLFLADWVPAKALEICFEIATQCSGIAVCLGLPLKYDGRLYNVAAMIENGNVLGFTAKQFLANEGVHYEPRWFTPWKRGQKTSIEYHGKSYPLGDILYQINGIKIAFEICEDAWVEDRPGIYHHKEGAQLILNPSASHFAFGKSSIRYGLVIGGSERFNCTYLYSNLLGNESGRMIFDGEVLVAHQGRLIQRNDRMSFQSFNLIYADIDFEKNEAPSVDLNHDDLTKEFEFWEATSLGLFDYMRKSNSKGFVLSLSGGADSSACAIMVAEMIRKGVRELGVSSFIEKSGYTNFINVKDLLHLPFEDQCKNITGKMLYTCYQATRNSGEDTFLSAKEIADSIGATFYHWSVDEEVVDYTTTIETAIGRKLTWETDDITLQNIQARSRAPIVWMLANIHRALLITTSNRSEGDVGYATMDGDTAGSIAPIAGVDKHFIRNWLIWAEKERDHHGLHRVNHLQPTAELRPAEKVQTDEKDLMPYSLLVAIERKAIKERQSPIQVYQQLKGVENYEAIELKNWIIKFFRMWSINQWKRERIAPSFHLDDFNVDPRTWCRFPILNSGFTEELKALEKLD